MFGHSFFSNLYIDKLDRDENDVAEFIAESEGLLSILDGKLRIIDLGIEGVETKEVDGKKQLIFAHSGLDYLQPLRHESQGTRSFITNFPDVILALQSGGVAIMDELDADLHPHLMAEIIRWFQDEGENEHHAQLIMSCHNASLIGDLEKDEVWFASKDSHGATSFIALSSFRGIRRGANLYSKYLSGQFGAIPKFG
jgi:AAA15 family ATPase/GTPase